MVRRGCSREDLLDRWRSIEEEEEEKEDDEQGERTILRMKEEWFSDTFDFLMHSSQGTHLWCGFWDLMGPLLETFHGYFDGNKNDSPLKLIWKRISYELNHCTQCVCQHYQAQETYNKEYESHAVGPLLKVLRTLDEERVTQHLKHINAAISQGIYNAETHASQVVSIMFEVLTFPNLLDDQSLVTEFESFIEAVDKSHEISLAGQQQYPGVYVLLFMKNSRVRAIGLRLARCMGKLRKATDLEPLQPLLRKYITVLETDLPSDLESSRPRVHLERITVWLGFKALLGFLESAAFEEGILERYPICFSIVLNHVSDDTPEFSYAVTCLRLFFEMLGCKLWLRTNLSPSVMRNTLLGQCFHIRNERSHKEIFDLFIPFLQSLEALQDGEHEKQRRHFLYFLLHQVTHSSNFSELMRKNARKIAFCIIHRGYQMNPPCPPFECSHLWGPSLVSSLKDLSLHNSLRQPAFDLIQTIIVSDCAALASIQSNLSSISSNADMKIVSNLYDDEDEIPLFHELELNESSCWNAFCSQSKLATQGHNEWRCIPLLWHDVFVGMDSSILPISFCKAVVWGISHYSVLDSDTSIEQNLSVTNWLSSYAGEILPSFVWEVPNGYEDGAGGKESKNSVNGSLMCASLIKTFKRFATHYVTIMEQLELQKQLTWEPRMAESLILLLISPTDTLRHANRIILEHVSKTRDLTSGLQFLSSSATSLSAIYMGLKYVANQVQSDKSLSTFQNLHHLFFIVRKLLKEVVAYLQQPPSNSKEEMNNSNLLFSGGFLRHPSNAISPVKTPGDTSSMVDLKLWSNFCSLLSTTMWPSILNCLITGKKFIDNKNCQMACVRLLEILPVVFEWICTSLPHLSQSSKMMVFGFSNFKWLFDLVDWGKSSLVVVFRHWKQSILRLINLLKGFHGCSSEGNIDALQKIMSFETIALDDLKEHLSQISLSSSKKPSFVAEMVSLKPSPSKLSYFGRIVHDVEFCSQGSKNSSITAPSEKKINNMEKDMIVIISDDEDEKVRRPNIPSQFNLSMDLEKEVYTDKHTTALRDIIHQESTTVCSPEDPLKHGSITKVVGNSESLSQQRDNDSQGTKLLFHDGKKTDCLGNSNINSGKMELKNLHVGGDISPHVKLDSALDISTENPVCCQPSDQGLSSRKINANKSNPVIKQLISAADDNALDLAVSAPRQSMILLNKPCISVPKCKLVQLPMPTNNKTGHFGKMDARSRRFRPPRLDDWYKPILELDYFSDKVDNLSVASHLKEVPLCFHSPDHYLEIFQPLVLEEFKAQMHNSHAEDSSSEELCSGILCVLSVERIDDFHLIRGSPELYESSASRGFSENDLIILTKDPLEKSSQPLHALGKVERRERNNKSRSTILSIRIYFRGGSPRLDKMKRFLIERSKWHISRVMNITPQLREFQALSSLNDIPLLPLILNPKDSSSSYSGPLKYAVDNLPEPMQRILKSSFNNSQLQAISSSIGHQGPNSAFDLSLIQGPPGTGKTKTIIAIVSALLVSKGAAKKNISSIPHSSAFINSKAQGSQTAAVARAWQDAALAKRIMQHDVKDYSESMVRSSRGRVLICAQSNAAVDELISRMSSGLYGNDGKMYKPFLVRVGNIRTVHSNSLPYFIDTLVDQSLVQNKIQNDTKRDVDVDSLMSLRPKLEKTVESIRILESRRARLRDADMVMKSSIEIGLPKVDDGKEMSDAEIGAKLKNLYSQKKSICNDIASVQARERKIFEENRLLKNKIRRSIMQEAEIVVTTLSGCGGDMYGVCSDYASCGKFGSFSEHSLFDAVVIDEAAQALEPATLIPLQLLKSNGTKCVMVGDPKQLPATVLSNVASKYLYECSMFERLQRAGHNVVMLTEQYRMHPEISKFPSFHFYENQLVNGTQMFSKSAPFHENSLFGPYLFFDVIDGLECQGKKSGSVSLYNEAEAEAVVEILKFLRKRFPSEFTPGRIGVITPYKRQLSVLRSRCSNEFGANVTGDMEFNTVDGFQGREVDILLFSTVRASNPITKKHSAMNSSVIGFVADVRRMNVALTRAKLSLWILGNERTLKTNLHWNSLVKDAKQRNLFISLSRPYNYCFEKCLLSNGQGGKHGNCHVNNPKEGDGKMKTITPESGKHTDKNIPSYNKKQKISLDKNFPHDHLLKIEKSPPVLRESEHMENNEVKGRSTQWKKNISSCDIHASREKTESNQDLTKGFALGRKPVEHPGCRNKEIQGKRNKFSGESQREKNEFNQQNPKGLEIDIQRQKHSATKTKLKKEKFVVVTGNSSSRNPNLMTSVISEASTDRHPGKGTFKNIINTENTRRDLIVSRKRQREAIDSLLSSSLISSKNSKVSLKSAPPKTTPPRPAFVRDVIRPVRSNKVHPNKSNINPKRKQELEE